MRWALGVSFTFLSETETYKYVCIFETEFKQCGTSKAFFAYNLEVFPKNVAQHNVIQGPKISEIKPQTQSIQSPETWLDQIQSQP